MYLTYNDTAITHHTIAGAEQRDLVQMYSQLYKDKMKMNRFFTKFLEESSMDEKDTDTAEWFTYKEMLKEYDRIESLIKSAEFYLRR